MSRLDEERARGKRLAEELVDHMQRMGGAAAVTLPVTVADASGRLCQWEVSVELKGVIDPAQVAPEPPK